eukprot:jgi/Chlat1/8292/Chrsp78S07710
MANNMLATFTGVSGSSAAGTVRASSSIASSSSRKQQSSPAVPSTSKFVAKWNVHQRKSILGSTLLSTHGGAAPLAHRQAAGVVRCATTEASKTKTIAVGDKLPDAKFAYFDEDGDLKEVSASELTKGKKVVLFAVPGAFTPTCSLKHLPGFIEKADELKGKGVSTIACVSVNDPFVMQAWGKSVGAAGKVMLLADGSGKFAQALGVELDLSDKGLGIRSRRYSMLVDDGVIKQLNLEEGGGFTTSGADNIIKALS